MGRTIEAYEGITMATMAERIGSDFGVDSSKIPPVLAAWSRAQILIPDGGDSKGRGNFRTFSEEELRKARILYELYWEGFPVRYLRAARRKRGLRFRRSLQFQAT